MDPHETVFIVLYAIMFLASLPAGYRPADHRVKLLPDSHIQTLKQP